MDYDLELVRDLGDRLILRTKNHLLAERYWRGELFFKHNGGTYYCLTTTEMGEYTYMRMNRDE